MCPNPLRWGCCRAGGVGRLLGGADPSPGCAVCAQDALPGSQDRAEAARGEVLGRRQRWVARQARAVLWKPRSRLLAPAALHARPAATATAMRCRVPPRRCNSTSRPLRRIQAALPKPRSAGSAVGRASPAWGRLQEHGRGNGERTQTWAHAAPPPRSRAVSQPVL